MSNKTNSKKSSTSNPKLSPSLKPGIGPVNDGALGSTLVEDTKRIAKADDRPKPEKVAIHSTKNVSWDGVGNVSKGYNIVTQAQADKWLTRSHIRMATPQEVAQEFGK